MMAESLRALISRKPIVVAPGVYDAFTALVASVTPSNGSNVLTSYDLQGSADFTGKLSGAVKNPRIDGQFGANDLQVQGTTWRTLRARVGIDSRSLKIDDGLLVGNQKEQINFNGSTELANWSFTPSSPLSLHKSRHPSGSHPRDSAVSQRHVSFPEAATSTNARRANGFGRGSIEPLRSWRDHRRT